LTEIAASFPLRTYFSLTKPGIIAGNAITAAAGFALASRGNINIWLLLATLAGLSFIIAAACVINNCLDRIADGKMVRTRNRVLVKGLVSVQNAVVFAIALGLCGIFVLARYTHLLTLIVALTGLFVYAAMYTLWKYRSSYGTLIGGIAGAVPPVVGYTAVSHGLDLGAFLLFAIIFFWQMPHFFAIAIYRLNDYAAASIPVLPIDKGMLATKKQMLFYTFAFTAAAVMLTFFGYTGYFYLSVAALLGLLWLRLCFKGFKTDNDTRWARQMFLFSLITVTVLSLMMAIDVRL
jgi:heme o synthase